VPLACATPRPGKSKPLDRIVVVTLDDLRSIGYSLRSDLNRFEAFERAGSERGALEIQYEFDPPRNAGIPLYLHALAELQPTDVAARASYSKGRAAEWAGARGLDVRSKSEWLEYGDVSNTEFAYAGEKPFALLFETRKGRRVFTLIVAGPVFDDLEIWRQVILRRLAALEALE
jgi:hypothetical protein